MARNIILLSNAYWPSIGGIENSLHHLAEEARRSGDKVKIIVSDLCVATDDPQRYSTKVDGISVERYPLAPLKIAAFKPINFFLAHWLLFRMLRREYKTYPDSIIVARFHICAVVALLAGFRRVRYLVPSIVRNQYEGEIGKADARLQRLRWWLFVKLHDFFQWWALRLCINFVFSETMRRQCVNFAGNTWSDYALAKPGVEPKRFRPADATERKTLRARFGFPTDKPVILFVGRFVKAKGVDLLIHAMADLRDVCHLVLVGEGSQSHQYQTLITNLGLSTAVSVVGATRAVEDYYRSADIFVMSSRYEPLGQTLLEALACGLPVVAFRPGEGVETATSELGMDEYITYSEAVTAGALAGAIRRRLSARREADSIEIAAVAQQKFSWAALYGTLTT